MFLCIISVLEYGASTSPSTYPIRIYEGNNLVGDLLLPSFHLTFVPFLIHNGTNNYCISLGKKTNFAPALDGYSGLYTNVWDDPTNRLV